MSMCFFRKKVRVQVNGKFKLGESIRFRYRGEICPGYIYKVYLDKDQHVVYDVQIGGECPTVIVNIKEEEILKISSKK